MEKQNLLLIVPGLSGGGQERITALTADILKDYYNVKIIIFSSNNIAYNTSVEVINLDVPSKYKKIQKVFQQIKRAVKLRRIKKEMRPVLSLSFGNTANLTNILSGKGGGTITSIRGYANIKKNLIDKIVYTKSDRIILISKIMKEKLENIYPFVKGKTEVLYNGLDIELAKKASLQENSIITLPHTKRIITVGRLTDVKGHRQLIKSFFRLKEQYENVSLIILGEGENLTILKELAMNLKIEDSVHFLGFQENPYSFIKQSDIFVLSSINEGFGNVLVEAMACEVPIVSTSCLAGPSEILGADEHEIDKVLYSKYGILVPTFKSDTSNEEEKEKMFANAMLDMLKNNSMREYYIQKSLERASFFGVENYTQNILKILNNL